MTETSHYDYVIVGGGTAGCVLANRLTQSCQYGVLLLHSGGSDLNPWIHIPLGYGKLVNNPKYDHMFKCDPEPELNMRVLQQSQGRMLGGGSSINGLVFIRGDRTDYDEWCHLGNPGWSYSDLLPIFRRMEDSQRGRDAYRGADGPVTISDQPDRYPLNEAFIDAAIKTGAMRNPDFNGATLEGVGYFQLNTRNGRRCSMVTAHLKPARRRRNLHVLTHALATRILFEGRSAVGIEFQHKGQVRMVRARREVILAAGAYGSPQLLQLSGIGPMELLQKHGVAVVQHLPGVGENLQNHWTLNLSFRIRRGWSLNQDVRSLRGRLWMGLRYALFRRGPLAANANHVGLNFRSAESIAAPDVRLGFSLFSRRGGDRAVHRDMHKFPGFTANVHQLRPENRGHVSIRNKDPHTAPRIQLNLSVTPALRQAITAGVRRMRNMIVTPAFSAMAPEELSPSRECITDDQVMELFRKIGVTSYHQVGTCKMGSDAAAVVDSRLRVHGIDHLCVVDASIMPNIVSANTHAATIMIAEKGADMILEGAR